MLGRARVVRRRVVVGAPHVGDAAVDQEFAAHSRAAAAVCPSLREARGGRGGGEGGGGRGSWLRLRALERALSDHPRDRGGGGGRHEGGAENPTHFLRSRPRALGALCPPSKMFVRVLLTKHSYCLTCTSSLQVHLRNRQETAGEMASAPAAPPRTGMPNLSDQRIDLKSYRAAVRAFCMP